MFFFIEWSLAFETCNVWKIIVVTKTVSFFKLFCGFWNVSLHCSDNWNNTAKESVFLVYIIILFSKMYTLFYWWSMSYCIYWALELWLAGLGWAGLGGLGSGSGSGWLALACFGSGWLQHPPELESVSVVTEATQFSKTQAIVISSLVIFYFLYVDWASISMGIVWSAT
jgi:hypothetical protein